MRAWISGRAAPSFVHTKQGQNDGPGPSALHIPFWWSGSSHWFNLKAEKRNIGQRGRGRCITQQYGSGSTVRMVNALVWSDQTGGVVIALAKQAYTGWENGNGKRRGRRI